MKASRNSPSRSEERALQGDDFARGVSAVDGTSKARIERAAVTLFAARGVDGTSTKDIAAAAQLSEAVIYKHFKNKADLAYQLMAAEQNRLTAMLRSAETLKGSLDDKVSQIVDDYCRAAKDDWALFTYYLLHFHRFAVRAPAPDAPHTAATDSPQKVAIHIVTQAQIAGDIPKGHSDLRASMALGVVLQAASAQLYGHISAPLSDKAPLLKSAIMAVLKAEAPHHV